MSLVSLSSESSVISNYNQASFNFKNHFNQPIILKPHSQVCLSSITFSGFVGSEFNIIGNDDPTIFIGNNKLLFGFADAKFTGDYDIAVLRPAVYTGADLATEIARALNEANRLRYFEFNVVFSEGNPQSNPITFDRFQISYTSGNDAVDGPGTWSRNRQSVATNVNLSTELQHSDTFPDPATKIQISDVVTGDPDDNKANTCSAFSWRKGLTQFESVDGGGSATFTIHCDGDGSDFSIFPHVAQSNFGLNRPSLCGSALDSIESTDPEMDFNGDTDIRIHTLYQAAGGVQTNSLHIVMNERVGTGNPFWEASSPKQVRVIDLDGILTNLKRGMQVLMVKITAFYITGDYIVQLYNSDDRGLNYTLLADDAGGDNTGTDTRPKVYTQDMGNGFAPFGGCIYTTKGIPDGAGGFINTIINSYDPSTVTMIPFVRFPRIEESFPQEAQNIITSINLTSDQTDSPCNATLNLNAGSTPPRVADNIYTIQFDSDTTGGYQGTISIPTPETGPGAVSGVPSSELNGKAFARDTTKKTYNSVLLYADNLTPLGQAVSVGELVIDLATEIITIAGSLFASGESWVGSFDGGGDGKPTTNTVPYYILSQSKENTEDSVMYRYKDKFPLGALSANGYSLVYDTEPTTSMQLGNVNANVLENPFRIITAAITQTDIETVGEGANRRLFVGNGRVANVNNVLGFQQNSYELLSSTTTLTTDAKPLKDLPIGEKQIHISIPELSNVKSLEGESSQRYKTIKVLPKTVFTGDDDGVVSYSANYEDWIDINNLGESQINELTMQLRNADGKLAKFVDGTTRATIKFREDPEKKQERMFDRLARQITQSQNPGQEILVNRGSFAGS